MIAHREIPPIQPGLAPADLEKLLIERFALVRDARDQWDLTLLVPAASWHDVAQFVRDDERLRCDTLLDQSGIDYLAYPGHRGPRFAVIANFKSTVFKHRVKLKVELDEDAADVASLHDLFAIANWQEREVFDQIGVRFTGHPNLKRLLNHHEFVGHPLRKDYPCQKRQKLSVNDPLVDQLEARLVAKGYTIIDRGTESKAAPITFKDGAR
jgi:NADH-quinone oxidoreductase subunit C